MGDGDELHALVDSGREGVHVHLAVGIVRYHLDDGARALGRGQVVEVVAGVFRARGEDAVPGRESHGEERQVPRGRRVLDEGYLVGCRAQERGDRFVDPGEAARLPVLRLVAADAGFEVEVRLDRVEHRRGHQRRAAIVEVDRLAAAGRLGAGALDVEGGARHIVHGVRMLVGGGLYGAPAGSWPVWRSASPNTIAAASATFKDRIPAAMGTRRRASAASWTASGTPAVSRPSSRVSSAR